MTQHNQCGTCGEEMGEFDGGFIDLDDADQCEACKANQTEGDTMDGDIHIEIEGESDSEPKGAGRGGPGAGGELIEFRSSDGLVSLRVALRADDVWATQAQIAELYGVDSSRASRHLRGAMEDGEITSDSVHADSACTAADGKTYRVKLYNLDAIIAVGYRARSPRAIEFRKWATRVLRDMFLDQITAPAAPPAPLPVAPAPVAPAPVFDQSMITAIAAAVAAALPPVIYRTFEVLEKRFDQLERPAAYAVYAAPDSDDRPRTRRRRRVRVSTDPRPQLTREAYEVLRKIRDRIVSAECEIASFRGQYDHAHTAVAARNRVDRRIRKVAEWPDCRIRAFPREYWPAVLKMLTGWEAAARQELDSVRSSVRTNR